MNIKSSVVIFLEKVQRVVSEHVIGKKPVMEFTIGALKDVSAE